MCAMSINNWNSWIHAVGSHFFPTHQVSLQGHISSVFVPFTITRTIWHVFHGRHRSTTSALHPGRSPAHAPSHRKPLHRSFCLRRRGELGSHEATKPSRRAPSCWGSCGTSKACALLAVAKPPFVWPLVLIDLQCMLQILFLVAL